METCILTGRELDAQTRKEHTIPRCLGGTITSRRVSCNEVNEAASGIEKLLQTNYLPLLYALAPLLKSSGKPGFAQAELEDGGRVRIDQDGVVEPARRFEMLANGTFMASDRQTAERILRAKGIDISDIQFVTDALNRAPEIAYYDRPCEVVSVDTELAALKAITFTLDEMLARQTLPRFTRHEALRPLRDYLRSALLQDDTSAHGRFARGYQYHRTAHIKRAARYIIGSDPTPFAHTILASGNVASRMLSAVWIAFDTAPIGFCLSTDWRERDFTCAVTCGVLRNTPGARMYSSDHARDIVRRTSMGATYFSDTEELPGDGAHIAAVAHFEAVQDAHKRATFLRETTCLEWIKNRLIERAHDFRKQQKQDVSVRDLLLDRLQRFIAQGDNDSEQASLQAAIDSALREPWAASADLLIEDRQMANKATRAYSRAFDTIATSRGLPDHLSRKDDALLTENREQ